MKIVNRKFVDLRTAPKKIARDLIFRRYFVPLVSLSDENPSGPARGRPVERRPQRLAAQRPEQAAGTPEQAAGTPEQAAGTPEQTAGTPEQAAATPEQAARTPEQAAGRPAKAAEEEPRRDRRPGRRRYLCQFCGMMFKKPCHLKEHENTHLHQLLYGCRTCGARFETRRERTRHERIHEEEPRRCPTCGQLWPKAGPIPRPASPAEPQRPRTRALPRH